MELIVGPEYAECSALPLFSYSERLLTSQLSSKSILTIHTDSPWNKITAHARRGEGRSAHAHISRVLRRANARWPGKRCRRGQSSGIESWSHRHIQRLLGSRGRRQDRRRSGPPREEGVYLRSDERKPHILRTFSARPRSERINLFSVARAFPSRRFILLLREDLESPSWHRWRRNDELEIKLEIKLITSEDLYFQRRAITFTRQSDSPGVMLWNMNICREL